jgi:MFS family permease
VETSYSWLRLIVLITLSTLGCVGLWSMAVALPAVQAEFGVHRAGASLPYTSTMIGFMIGGITVGRLADRFGIPAVGRGHDPHVLRCILTAFAPTLAVFAVISGLTIGLGGAASFAPLVADLRCGSTGTAASPSLLGHYRQLSFRCGLAALHPALHRRGRLAPDPYRHQHLLRPPCCPSLSRGGPYCKSYR